MGTAPAFSLRFSHEYLLYCYKGKFIPVASDSRGVFPDVIHAKPRRHSQKPEESFVLIQSLYPNLVKLEMYARETRVGWDSFGNEV
jgi:N6-adenosine-specific RNA methylase IME4